MQITLDLTGVGNVQEALARLVAQFPEAAGAALYQEGELLRAESQSVVPVDTGILKGSAFVNTPQTDSQGTFVTVGYGGAAKAYALRQHEDTTFRHREGQQAKFLEQPLLGRAKNLAESLAARIRRSVGL
ncbi:MAG: hypothetical protein NUW22_12610 [Acidobacteria bacterium]|nr:hypothetical protein [Acidobacteriota bacterium]